MAPTPTTKITQSINAHRIETGTPQAELAKSAAIPVTTLQRRLANDDKLTLPELFALNHALGGVNEVHEIIAEALSA